MAVDVAVAVPAGLTGVLTLGNTSVLWGLSPPHTRGGTPVRFPNTCLLGDASPVPERPGPPTQVLPIPRPHQQEENQGLPGGRSPLGSGGKARPGVQPMFSLDPTPGHHASANTEGIVCGWSKSDVTGS